MTDGPGAESGGPIDWSGGGAPPSPESDAPDEDAAEAAGSDDPGGDDAAGPDAGEAPAEGGPPTDAAPGSVEAERDDYLDRLQRLQAEFDNFRKRMTKEQSEAHERGVRSLASELLTVLDGADAALQQGHDDVGPIHHQLLEILGRAGLEVNAAPGDPFDPEQHEAVMHEPGEGDDGGSTVAEVLRAGYSWKGRVLRPAMVKVRG